jgi:hypothetical protein
MNAHVHSNILCLTLAILLMDLSTMTAFAPPSQTQNADPRYSLIPSQVSRMKVRIEKQSSSVYQSNTLPVDLSPHLTPQLMVASSTVAQLSDGPATNDGILKRSRRRTRTKKKQAAAAKTATTKNAAAVNHRSTSTANTDASVTTLTANNSNFPLAGNLPDIYWRAISMDHLRQHPNFIPLPEPHTIRELNELEQVRNFRQQSWQWDTLHHGRCTTSQAVAALGFLEPLAGEFLNVPLSWRRGAMGAFVRLREKPMRTLDDMNRVLIQCDSSPHAMTAASPSGRLRGNPVWSKEPLRNGSPFAANYQYSINIEEMQERKKYARKLSQNDNLGKTIRMMWGNTQESTALLTAINFFTKDDPNCYLEEVGMCGAGLELNTTTQFSSLLIGATPDGVLRYSDDRIEALEVKNHCPFFGNSHIGNGKNKGGKRKRFIIGCMPLDDDKGHGIFMHYVPQLQLEMLCLGPECRSAIMIRQTATAGALVLRMHRDDEWVDEMLHWLHRFHIDFVKKNTPPPKNFFWNSSNKEDRARYRRFANKTKEIRTSRVEVVRRIHNDDIQRMGDDAALFLD